MNEENSVLELMKYRVPGSNAITFMSRIMTHDEIIKRRAAMRQILKESRFNNSSNDALDGMRIEKTVNGYIVKDLQGYETVIGYKLKKAPSSDTNTDKGKANN